MFRNILHSRFHYFRCQVQISSRSFSDPQRRQQRRLCATLIAHTFLWVTRGFRPIFSASMMTRLTSMMTRLTSMMTRLANLQTGSLPELSARTDSTETFLYDFPKITATKKWFQICRFMICSDRKRLSWACVIIVRFCRALPPWVQRTQKLTVPCAEKLGLSNYRFSLASLE